LSKEEEEKKLSHLEKRLVANVDFDDQALDALGFGTDIYYMLGHLGWVQFSNGVSANTHKEFALEILMTMAPILDEGCKVYHSIWRESNKWFPTSIISDENRRERTENPLTISRPIFFYRKWEQ
jgi:hypothetical protein